MRGDWSRATAQAWPRRLARVNRGILSVVILAITEALSQSTPVLVSVSAAATVVAVAFGMGLGWAKWGARLDKIDGKDGAVERLTESIREAKKATAEEFVKLRRELADLDRDGSAGDASLASRIHRLGDIVQDLQVRIAQAETHIGYDGRGQTTPVRAEPVPRPPKRRTTDPPPGDSRG